MVAHSALTGANLHEPKGADTASSGQVYVADGSGSGTWQKVTTSELDTSSVINANEFYMYSVIDDLSTAANIYVPIPTNCTLNKAITVLANAITNADATLTFKNHAGTTIDTLVITQSGSAEGDVDTVTFSTNNTFTEEQRLEVETDGGSTTTAKLYITYIFTKTA